MKYAHIFNSASKRGSVELYVTDTPSLAGSTVHSVHPDKRAAKAAAKALSAKPWNY